MNNYYDHGRTKVCSVCGELIPRFEHESCNAERRVVNRRVRWICSDCQNQKTPETLAEYGLTNR